MMISRQSVAYNVVLVNDKPACEVARIMIEEKYQKDPFYLFDFDVAYECIQTFKRKMPRVHMFYAIKANDHEMMLRLAIASGLGFDCASPGEINKVLIHNIHPTSIIYAVTMKTPEQMVFARESGIKHTTFDSLGELKRLKQYWPDCKLLIRVKVESDSVYKLGDKFGCEYTDALTLLDEARILGMDVAGVAFHVGSACFSSESYTHGLKTARELFEHEAQAGRKMTLLDIGGGFFDYSATNFSEVAAIINDGLEQWFPDPEVQVIAEPGRYVCEPAFTLYTNIRDVRNTKQCTENIKTIYLNSGTNGTLRFIEDWHKMNVFKKPENICKEHKTAHKTILWGPTMDDNDFLPVQMAPVTFKDWLVFYDQGAYCAVFKSEFCGMEKTHTVCVVSQKLWLKLRDNAVFSSCKSILESDVSSLPSTLPPLYSQNSVTAYVQFQHQLEGFKTLVNSAYVLDKDSSEDVAKAIIRGEQTQPFYIFNMDETYLRVQHMQYTMPRIKIFYGVKSNDTDIMLRVSGALGMGFSCASPEEIYKTLKLNISPKRILYSMPCKTTGEMEYAKKSGVELTTFDSAYELKKLKIFWPEARLLLRIKISDEATGKHITKFGCDYDSEAKYLLDEAARLGLNVVGIAFHTDSKCFAPENYVIGLRRAKFLFGYEFDNGRKLEIVDIGGGFPSDQTDVIEKVSYLINETLEELFPDPDVQIIAEPGRYLCDSAFTLYCSIMGVREEIRDNKLVNMIYLNDGIHGTMRFDEDARHLRKYQRSNEEEPILDEEIILWGPTGDSIDRVMEHCDVKLPRCSSSDWLIFHNHGAYTFSYSTRFSTLDVPVIQPVLSKSLWQLLRISPMFSSSDFTLNPNISAPLPSTIPDVVITRETNCLHPKVPRLKA